MRFCYFTGGQSVPSVRFRMPFWELTRREGHDCRVFHARPDRYHHYPLIGWRMSQKLRAYVTRSNIKKASRFNCDSVVIETGLVHAEDYEAEKEIRRIAKRMVYDIDDGVFLLFPNKCAAIASMADHVIAGNERIADWARLHNPSVSIIPTCVDERLYRGKPVENYQSPSKPIIGWIGSAGNVPFLADLRQPLIRLAKDYEFRFRIISKDVAWSSVKQFEGVNCEFINIDRCDITREVELFDIGVMPLPLDDPWMQFKSNAKMIQYMASGIAPVATAVGLNLELVRPGETGWLATNSDDWERGLASLLEDSGRRQRMGLAARASVLDRYTVQSQLQKFKQALLGES